MSVHLAEEAYGGMFAAVPVFFVFQIAAWILVGILKDVLNGEPGICRAMHVGLFFGSLAGIAAGPICIAILMFIQKSCGENPIGAEILIGSYLGPPAFGMLGGFLGLVLGYRNVKAAQSAR